MTDQPDDDRYRPVYKRVLLKLSGEAFGKGGSGSGIDISETVTIAKQLSRLARRKVQVAVVVGGGNHIRGAQFSANQTTIKPATADYMGMIATVMNGLALQDALESLGVPTRLMSAIPMELVAERYIRRRAIRHLEKERIIILAGGTGNPFVTTDTAAALRGRELEVDILLKATRVDGVYDSDPEQNSKAKRYECITYDQAIQDKLKVMDVSAFDHCEKANLPIIVFDYNKENALDLAVAGQPVGTLVCHAIPESVSRT
jgi:uridylate kinase